MGIAKVYSAQLVGLSIAIVTVEVDISHGLNNFSIVGLGDRSVNEAKDRISAAIKNSGHVSPKQKNQKVVISLAPADVRKEGSLFDLAMALSYLSAAGEIYFEAGKKLFLGELSLEGNVRRVNGILPILCQAAEHGFTEVFIPAENSEEASLARGIEIYPVSTLEEILRELKGEQPLVPLEPVEWNDIKTKEPTWIDMNVIRGNQAAKRALEIAATGAHNIIMCGPPGTGKTMLAQSFCSILPPLSYEQAVEVTGIHSVARALTEDFIIFPPFRSPHHTASYPSIVGGGSVIRPGEVSLAHRGVLFMDEFPEFSPEVIEALRQPLEDRMVTISRARGTITFPAQCILLASMNPCPCGRGKDQGCVCNEYAIKLYWKRISGPIMDRFDIWINVNRVDYDLLAAKTVHAESSATIVERVRRARKRQLERFQKFDIHKLYNSEMNAKDIERCLVVEEEARFLLRMSARKLEISGRAFHRTLKVAQTIADLAGSETIKKPHVLEALQYREKRSAYVKAPD